MGGVERYLGRPSSNSRDTECNCEQVEDEVPPLGNCYRSAQVAKRGKEDPGTFGVVRHHPSVDILEILRRLLLEAPEQTLEAQRNVVAMKEDRIGDCRGVDAEEVIIHSDAAGGQVDGGVGLVLGLIQPPTAIKNLGDVVRATEMIVHEVRVNREVGRVVRIRPVEPDDRDAADEDADEGVERDAEGDDKGLDDVGCDVPVKGRQRVEAETFAHTGDGCQGEVVGCNPRDPVEEGERAEDVVWEPEPDEHAGERRQEEAVAGYAVDLLEGAGDWVVCFCRGISIVRLQEAWFRDLAYRYEESC